MSPPTFQLTYEDDLPLWNKMEAVAKKIYSASEIVADTKVRAQVKRLQEDGFGEYPICVAKNPVFVFDRSPDVGRA